MFFLFVDQYNYNQPPKSLREPTCRKSTLPHDTLGIAEALLFLVKGGEKEVKVETLFVGVNGEKVVDSKETIKQIEKVRALECALETKEGENVTWNDVDNPDEPRTLFQSILRRPGK